MNLNFGKERYHIFKVRYYIKLDNITNYYYDKYSFVKAIVETIKEYEISKADELRIRNILNKML